MCSRQAFQPCTVVKFMCAPVRVACTNSVPRTGRAWFTRRANSRGSCAKQYSTRVYSLQSVSRTTSQLTQHVPAHRPLHVPFFRPSACTQPPPLSAVPHSRISFIFLAVAFGMEHPVTVSVCVCVRDCDSERTTFMLLFRSPRRTRRAPPAPLHWVASPSSALHHRYRQLAKRRGPPTSALPHRGPPHRLEASTTCCPRMAR